MTCTQNLINQWRARLLESAADVFGAEPAVDVTVMHFYFSALIFYAIRVC